MKLKPILLYILFFIIAVFLFLFLLFPEREVAGSLSRLLTNLNSNVQVSIDKVKLRPPLKLSLKNTKVLINQSTEIVTKSFDVFLGPAVFLNTEKPLSFQSDFYQGSVKGSLNLNRIDPLLFSQLNLFVSNVNVSDFRYKTGLADITLKCEIKGDYKQIEALPKNESGKPGKKNSGQGTIFIQNFSAEMKNSLFNVLNLPTIDFTTIKLEFTQSEKKVTITQCIAKGSIINVKLKGIVDIVSSLQNARLNLTGIVLPDSPYLAKFANTASIKSVVKNISKQGIRFNIKGTLNHPEIGI